MSETPETDALDNELSNYDWDEGYGRLLERARKLERERNEARNIVSFALDKDYYEKYQNLCAEIDQLRMVADELAKQLDIAKHTASELTYHNSSLAIDTYNSIPHVIEMNKAK